MNIIAHLEPHIEHIYEKAVHWRRYLHENPELSFQETKTSAWIQKKLEDMGCQVQRCTQSNGLIVSIVGDLKGPTIALRADMDGLPIQDEKTVAYASKVPNVMHACGHDGHTATLLAIADFYMQHIDELKGERRLLFQPAEEVAPGGAAPMIAEGALQGVDVVYGVHLWTPLPYGKVSTRAGNFMSAVDDFYIDIQGLGGHGGMPHDTVDTIVVGTQFVQSLQTIVSRNINPMNPAVVTVGSFQAGHASNIIADRCGIKGTIRTFDEPTRTLIHNKLDNILTTTCEMYGATYSYNLKKGYPSVINDENEANRVLSVARDVIGIDNVIVAEPIMIAEDFSYYLKEVPGCFMFVGAGNEDCQATYAHHHAKFDIDERSMKNAIRMLVHVAEQYAH